MRAVAPCIATRSTEGGWRGGGGGWGDNNKVHHIAIRYHMCVGQYDKGTTCGKCHIDKPCVLHKNETYHGSYARYAMLCCVSCVLVRPGRCRPRRWSQSRSSTLACQHTRAHAPAYDTASATVAKLMSSVGGVAGLITQGQGQANRLRVHCKGGVADGFCARRVMLCVPCVLSGQ
jgi:hypothetical protein